jgi:predicted ABC-type ATPase
MEINEPQQPRVVVLAGPNGAGKTTCAATLLPEGMDIRQFVNADTIAAGLSAFAPDTAAIQAGRIPLARVAELARQRQDFAFETTLASRSFAPFLRKLQQDGYHVHLIYIWLRTPELALLRVAERVRQGGHSVPAEVVSRRYRRGLANLTQLYQPLADTWIICDNSSVGSAAEVIARGCVGRPSKCWIRDYTMKSEKQPLAVNGEDWRTDSKAFADLVRQAMRKAAQGAIEEHHRAGNPVGIWRDGQVVLWYPDGSFRPVDPSGEQ